MRNIIIASHHRLAEGMADTLNFITGFDTAKVYAAYLEDDHEDPDKHVVHLMASLSPDDETFICTDMLGGSVTQRFYAYMNEHTHLICGMNLPLILELALHDSTPFTTEEIAELIDQARQALLYVNTYEAPALDEDE